MIHEAVPSGSSECSRETATEEYRLTKSLGRAVVSLWIQHRATQPEEDNAPGTHDNHSHEDQLCRVCQGEKGTGCPVAPEDSGMAGGDTTGDRAQRGLRPPVWHGDWKATNAALLAWKLH